MFSFCNTGELIWTLVLAVCGLRFSVCWHAVKKEVFIKQPPLLLRQDIMSV
jgi:hypothetical protein